MKGLRWSSPLAAQLGRGPSLALAATLELGLCSSGQFTWRTSCPIGALPGSQQFNPSQGCWPGRSLGKPATPAPTKSSGREKCTIKGFVHTNCQMCRCTRYHRKEKRVANNFLTIERGNDDCSEDAPFCVICRSQLLLGVAVLGLLAANNE